MPKAAVEEKKDNEAEEAKLVIAELKLQGLKERESSLMKENAELKEKIKTLEQDQEDIFRHLSSEVAKAKEETLGKEKQMTHSEETHEKIVSQMQEKWDADKKEQKHRIETLEVQLRAAEIEIESMVEFKKRKHELETDLQNLKDTLEAERKKNKETINDMERRFVQEKERMRKEMEARLEDTKTMFIKMTDEKLDETTKRTIIENDHMSTELSFQSRESAKIISQNQQLREEVTSQRQQAELARETHKELVERNSAYLSTVKKLTKKVKELEEKNKMLEMAIMQVEKRTETRFSEDIKALKREIEDLKGEKQTLTETLGLAQSILHKIQTHRDQVLRFILQCMNDARVQLAKEGLNGRDITASPGAADASVDVASEVYNLTKSAGPLPRIDDLPAEGRERVLRLLFSKLSAFHVAQITSPTADSPPTMLPPISSHSNNGSEASSHRSNRTPRGNRFFSG